MMYNDEIVPRPAQFLKNLKATTRRLQVSKGDHVVSSNVA